MLEQNQEQFDESLYQSDNKKKTIKKVVLLLVIILALVGIIFFVLRDRNNVKNNQTGNIMQSDNMAGVSQVMTGLTGEEEIKRVEEQLAKFADDKDRDGLSAEKEKELGTSDNDSDTDWDNISDKDEIEKWMTDPLKADTDGDGYSDGFEINAGFNPKGPGKL